MEFGHLVSTASPERALFVISVASLSLISPQSSPLLIRHSDDQNRSEDPLARCWPLPVSPCPRVLDNTRCIRGRVSVSNVAMSQLATTVPRVIFHGQTAEDSVGLKWLLPWIRKITSTENSSDICPWLRHSVVCPAASSSRPRTGVACHRVREREHYRIFLYFDQNDGSCSDNQLSGHRTGQWPPPPGPGERGKG